MHSTTSFSWTPKQSRSFFIETASNRFEVGFRESWPQRNETLGPLLKPTRLAKHNARSLRPTPDQGFQIATAATPLLALSNLDKISLDSSRHWFNRSRSRHQMKHIPGAQDLIYVFNQGLSESPRGFSTMIRAPFAEESSRSLHHHRNFDDIWLSCVFLCVRLVCP